MILRAGPVQTILAQELDTLEDLDLRFIQEFLEADITCIRQWRYACQELEEPISRLEELSASNIARMEELRSQGVGGFESEYRLVNQRSLQSIYEQVVGGARKVYMG